MAQIPMTRNGLEALKGELQRLKSVDRPEIIEAIAEARAQGDYLKMLNTNRLKKNKVLSKEELQILKLRYRKQR